ncbi:MAG: DUF2116 family Zn-ribbon domain-containing protein [Euryarchaeota archaeon]|nr:DUF2116 family Zn-ribbon domain-containing protein [Euryarchaeota archaeon]
MRGELWMAERRFIHNKCLSCGREVNSSQDFCSDSCESQFFSAPVGTSPPRRL